MIKPMHQMIHEQFMKDKDKLPSDFEARMKKMMDDSMKSFPWDEMMQAMVPAYQKHFTKGDMDTLEFIKLLLDKNPFNTAKLRRGHSRARNATS